DLAHVAQSFFNKTGLAAEIGVFMGNLADKNVRKWNGRYYMVDVWGPRSGDSQDKNLPDAAWHKQNMKEAIRRTRHAGGRAWPIRGLSVDVAERFAEEALDWIYIDAEHTYGAVIADLDAWYPKVRWGGLLSGDDYGDANDTELMTTDRYMSGISKCLGWRTETARHHNWGTMRAVQEFARRKGHQLFVTWMVDCYPYPAWYFVKG
ncbi:unnamed protein product, partial [Polarella glacialis]